MGLLDQMLGNLGGFDVAGLAGRVGLTPEQVESALGALGRARAEPGDTAGLAAAKTGLPVDKLQEMLGHLGGEHMLDQLLPALGQEGGLNLGGLARGFFER